MNIFGEYFCQMSSLYDPAEVTMVIKKEGYKEGQQTLYTEYTSRPIQYYFALEKEAPISFIQTLEPS